MRRHGLVLIREPLCQVDKRVRTKLREERRIADESKQSALLLPCDIVVKNSSIARAAMTHLPPGISRTLPKSFACSSGGDTPKTPSHLSPELEVPPPLRPSSYRVRRPRWEGQPGLLARLDGAPTIFDFTWPDHPIPSIEFPPSSTPSKTEAPVAASANPEFLQVPSFRRMEFKTPPAQIRAAPYNGAEESERSPSDDHATIGGSIERPGSACSYLSDSSVSSVETMITQPSLGGSCTSPESDIFDANGFKPEETRKLLLESPMRNTARPPTAPPRKRTKWTAETDKHLWNTYQAFLQDPTLTPFKLLPGKLPPLGVSYRVARAAKRSWNRTHAKRQGHPVSESAAPDNTGDGRGGSVTPTAANSNNDKKLRWPGSEAATRRRLKYLCTRKPMVAPHYQRLLLSRSPSPAVEPLSFSGRVASRAGTTTGDSTRFTTRDLGMSLVSSSLPSNLSQLAMPPPSDKDNDPTRTPGISFTSVPSDSPSEDKSRPADPVPRLGSPFMYHTWGPDGSRRHASPVIHARRETIHVTDMRRTSPSRLVLHSNAPKRRADHEPEVSPDLRGVQRNVRELVRDGKLRDGQRRVRLRNRGNTTSVLGSRERMQQLLSSASPFAISGSMPNTNPENSAEGERIRRLGSPFELDNKRRLISSPRTLRHVPSLSDPFTIGSRSHIQRERTSSLVHEQQLPTHLPYDSTEDGISDAERIKRQILNLPFMKMVRIH